MNCEKYARPTVSFEVRYTSYENWSSRLPMVTRQTYKNFPLDVALEILKGVPNQAEKAYLNLEERIENDQKRMKDLKEILKTDSESEKIGKIIELGKFHLSTAIPSRPPKIDNFTFSYLSPFVLPEIQTDVLQISLSGSINVYLTKYEKSKTLDQAIEFIEQKKESYNGF